MMDWVQVVSAVGFPIAAFLLIYLDLRRIIEKHTVVIEKLLFQLETLRR